MTHQGAALTGMCIVVSIDGWPEDSALPLVRLLFQYLLIVFSIRYVFEMNSEIYVHVPCSRSLMFAKGHFVRTLGPAGETATETEAVLIEHDVPYEPFTQAVLR